MKGPTPVVAWLLAVLLANGALLGVAPAAAQDAADGTCFDDLRGDTSTSSGQAAFPRADITQFCLQDADTVSVTLTVAEPTDPNADANWDDEDTFAAWGVDTDGDGAENFTIVYGIESNGQLEGVVVDASNDLEVCTATPSSGGVYGVQDIPRSCLGDARRVAVNASMFYDSAAADAEAPVYVDDAPDDGTYRRQTVTAGDCQDAPEASDYVDRDSARETHRRNVDCVIHVGIAVGSQRDGRWRYAPLADVTRGQMASFIVNTLVAAGYDDRLPPGDGVPAFRDIAGTTHERSINRLADADIVSGTGGGRYAPGARLSRQQMATFMVRAAEFATGSALPARQSSFGDVARSSPHHGSINAGYEAGLFTGTTGPRSGEARSGRFSPASNVKRDQMASFLINLLAAS